MLINIIAKKKIFFLLLPFLHTFALLSLLVRMVGATSHFDLFLCNSMQLRTPEAVVRKRQWRALTYKETSGLISLGTFGKQNGIALI